MDLSKIISVTGKPGLYRIVAQGRQALIVESLIDGKRAPVHTSVRVSTLDEISMFTTEEDVPLGDVLKKLFELEKGKASLDPKADENELFGKLSEVLPNHDRERIYASDLRKLFAWYDLLLKAGEFEESVKAASEKEEGGKDTEAKKAGKKGAATKKAAKDGGTKKKSAPKKVSAPKPAGTSKPKATTMRKSAQRGS